MKHKMKRNIYLSVNIREIRERKSECKLHPLFLYLRHSLPVIM